VFGIEFLDNILQPEEIGYPQSQALPSNKILRLEFIRNLNI
jgi:hypothetical protein